MQGVMRIVAMPDGMAAAAVGAIATVVTSIHVGDQTKTSASAGRSTADVNESGGLQFDPSTGPVTR